MPVLFVERLTRKEARRRPEVMFVFGDNEARRGTGGQAEELRGEPNAVGVATKRYPSTDELAYWREDETFAAAPSSTKTSSRSSNMCVTGERWFSRARALVPAGPNCQRAPRR